jgi:hypothetical protein
MQGSFEVGNDTCTQGPAEHSIGLLSPEAEGVGIVHRPGGFQLRKVNPIPISSEISNRDFSCSDTSGCLASFVVDDEEVILYDLSQESLLE